MKYISVCSGIEAATVAWHHMGWQPAAFSEIEKFPSAVLSHHYPSVPNWGDMTKFQEWPDACRCVSNRQHELLRKTNRAFDGIGREKCSAIHSEQSTSSCGGNRSSNKGHICEVCNGTIVNVLVGGTPCQSFSVAGLRKGLDDPRGNLMLTFGSIAQRYRPQWLVWENVPGVLSSNGGRDFGSFLGMLGQLGYGFAYRVLDAQFFGVAQRRRRVFVVGYLGDWHRAAAVLFERHSLSGHPAPSRQARKGTAGSVAPGVDERGIQHTVGTLCADTHPGAYSGQDAYTGKLVPQPLTFKVRGGVEVDSAGNSAGKGYLGSEECAFTLATTQDQWLAQPIPIHDQATRYSGKRGNNSDGKGNGLGIGQEGDPAPTLTKGDKHAVAVAFGGDIARSLTARHDSSSCADRSMDMVAVPMINMQGSKGNAVAQEDGPSFTLNAMHGHDVHAVAVAQPVPYDFYQITAPVNKQNRKPGDPCHTLARDNAAHATIVQTMQVRRLTPVECERLQGFPDGYTAIPWRNKPAAECPDGPRYKALGNSMAVPVMRWIGERINQVEQI